MVAKKTVPAAAPELPADALVPERPESKVEAGLKAERAKAEPEQPEPSASEAGQAMLADDAAAMEQLISERAAEVATATLVKLGVPEDVARLAVAGDLDAAAAAADGVTVAEPGKICTDCFAEGWDTPAVAGFSGVGCVHGTWKR